MLQSWQPQKMTCFSRLTNNQTPHYYTLKNSLDYDYPDLGPITPPFHPAVLHAVSWKCSANKTNYLSKGPWSAMPYMAVSEPRPSAFLISNEPHRSLPKWAMFTVHTDRRSPLHCRPMSKKAKRFRFTHEKCWVHHGEEAFSKWGFWGDTEWRKDSPMLSSTLVTQGCGELCGVQTHSHLTALQKHLGQQEEGNSNQKIFIAQAVGKLCIIFWIFIQNFTDFIISQVIEWLYLWLKKIFSHL